MHNVTLKRLDVTNHCCRGKATTITYFENTALWIKFKVLYNVTPFRLVKCYRRFEVSQDLNL